MGVMVKTPNSATNQVGRAFVQRYQGDINGVLHGWDRLRLQGTLRSLYHPSVMDYYLKQSGVLWKDFKRFVTGLTDRVRQAAAALAIEHRRPMIYLPSSRTSKEDAARQIQERDKVESGLIAVLSCVEPCRRWIARGNRASQKLELRLEWGKCTHLYFYWLHEQLGFLHLRLQTWFPFLIQVCLNGREWLAHQMDAAGIAYRREENCFPWIGDVAGAQALMAEQLRTHWPSVLEPLVRQCHPLCAEITRPIERDYYWTAAESEYATDVMFGERGALERIYPSLVHHGVMSFGSEQVLRFLGHSGRSPVQGEVKTDRRRRSEGVRIKHWVNQNSVKCYDKGSILRVETTINDPKDFRVWRGPENNPEGKSNGARCGAAWLTCTGALRSAGPLPTAISPHWPRCMSVLRWQNKWRPYAALWCSAIEGATVRSIRWGKPTLSSWPSSTGASLRLTGFAIAMCVLVCTTPPKTENNSAGR